MNDTESLLEMLQEGQSELKERHPEILESFQGLSRAVHREGALSPKFKELIGIAVSVAIHCQP